MRQLAAARHADTLPRTALRHFHRHRLTTAINVVCLALGLSCFLLVYALTAHFGASDRHFEKSERTYVITQKLFWGGSDLSAPTAPNTTWPVAKYLRSDFPELEAVARVSKGREMPAAADGRKEFLNVAFAEPAFLDIFDFRLLEGDRRNALRQPRSVLLTEQAALRLFGTRSALGQSLLINNSQRVYVTGIFAASDEPSHMALTAADPLKPQSFEALVSDDVFLSMLEASGRSVDSLERWTNGNGYYTYAVLPADGSLDASTFERRLSSFASHVPPAEGRSTFSARPVSEIFELSLNVVMGTDKTGISSMTLLAILAGVVLLISCLNYANLATAQAATRARETALQRTIGARPLQVVMQTFVEALLLTLAALLLALMATAVLTFLWDESLRIDATAVLFGSPGFWGTAVLLVLSTSAVASAYPALIQGRVRPAEALRVATARRSSGRLTTFLVATQFAAASFLVICVLVMRAQNEELKQGALRLAADPVVVLASDPAAAGINIDALRAELRGRRGIKWVTGVDTMPWSLNVQSRLLAAGPAVSARQWQSYDETVDYDFFSSLGIRVLAGRDFRRDAADVRAQGRHHRCRGGGAVRLARSGAGHRPIDLFAFPRRRERAVPRAGGHWRRGNEAAPAARLRCDVDRVHVGSGRCGRASDRDCPRRCGEWSRSHR